MRFMFPAAAAACVLLTACGGEKSSQANNAQANISTDSRTADTAVATTAALPTAAPATRDEALKIMHERHEGMEGMGKAAKAIGRELKSGSANLETIRKSAKAITDFAPHVLPLFPPGTGPDMGKTGAKPAIWQNGADFEAHIRDFQAATRAFADTAAHIDRDALRTSFGELQKTCKGCHDKYRAEMKH